MLVLFESAAGYGLFKVRNEGKISEPGDLYKEFQSAEAAANLVEAQVFQKFADTAEAMEAAVSSAAGKLGKGLKKFLKKHAADSGDTIGVLDIKLGGILKEKLSLNVVNNDAVRALIRGIRSRLDTLVDDLTADEVKQYNLGLAHSLSRYKLKFSPDKVDTMIVQAINLLDELDKEINIYAMRVREWFGWHFPEMGKIVVDNLQYAKSVLKMQTRDRLNDLDLSDILTEEVEEELKTVAITSMGTEISPSDVINIGALADQVIMMTEYRAQLYEYLKNRMHAIAPNLTVLVGELVGARLIAHAGSLLNLAKQPASTVQILGAEKALFRALKTKSETPKYGLIYHASLIGQSAPQNKGKISRVLAAKCALAIRVDALGDYEEPTVGIEGREKVEARLRQLENKPGMSSASSSAGTPQKKFKPSSETGGKTGYSDAADSVGKRKRDEDSAAAFTPTDSSAKKKAKKEKKEKSSKKEKKKKRSKDEDGGSAKKKKKKSEKE